MERAPLLRLKREIEASGDEEAVEPQEDHHHGDQHDPDAGGDGEDHPQVEPDGDDEADADEGDDDKADGDPDGGHLDISETEEAEASGDDHIIDYLRE